MSGKISRKTYIIIINNTLRSSPIRFPLAHQHLLNCWTKCPAKQKPYFWGLLCVMGPVRNEWTTRQTDIPSHVKGGKFYQRIKISLRRNESVIEDPGSKITLKSFLVHNCPHDNHRYGERDRKTDTPFHVKGWNILSKKFNTNIWNCSWKIQLAEFLLTHWGRVTHICISKLTIIGSDNGLSPSRRQAIIWTNAGILLIESLGTNFSEILIGIQTFSLKKMHLKISSGKWRPFCLSLNVLNILCSLWHPY